MKVRICLKVQVNPALHVLRSGWPFYGRDLSLRVTRSQYSGAIVAR